MAGFLVLIPSITEALITGAVVAGSSALTNFTDQEAARDDLPPEPFEDVASEVAGFNPGAEPQVVGTGSKLETLKDDDDDFTSMVLAATPRANPAPGGPSQNPSDPPHYPETTPKRTKNISIPHVSAAYMARGAMKAALDYLAGLPDAGDEMATLIEFLKQADATLHLTKLGVEWQSIVDKVSGANNQLMNFLKQVSDPNWVSLHISASIDPKLLQLAITAWTTFTQALGKA